MTREEHFRTTLISQLELFTPWEYQSSPQLKRMPPSSFPGFRISLDETRYTHFTFFGVPYFGEQDFRLAVYYQHDADPTGDSAYQTRSDDIKLIEQFFNGIYSPPPMSVGDTYRIELAKIEKIEPAAINGILTRFAFAVKGKYLFTML